MSNRIAIIPARGGSKRIPKKNILPFCGRPMITWTILAALKAKLFTRVLVSTDDAEIAEIAVSAGADVPFLRESNADDDSPVSLATLAALEQAEAHWFTHFDTVVQLMPNCPLRGAAEILAALDHFDSGKHEFQISVFEFGWMNPWWALRMRPDGQPDWVFPEALNKRSQDLEPLYCPTGAIWVATGASLRERNTFYGPGHVTFPMAWDSALDIDEINDLRMGEALALIRNRGLEL